nr:MAG TPA: hypothetical protein [Caudoviricetes sp.]
MTEIIRRLLCSKGKGKGASTETVYAIYRRAVCPPDVGGEISSRSRSRCRNRSHRRSRRSRHRSHCRSRRRSHRSRTG